VTHPQIINDLLLFSMQPGDDLVLDFLSFYESAGH